MMQRVIVKTRKRNLSYEKICYDVLYGNTFREFWVPRYISSI